MAPRAFGTSIRLRPDSTPRSWVKQRFWDRCGGRTARIVDALGLERVMFEAADPDVLAWYVKNYGPQVNLFVDHSQIIQLECLRAGIWGRADLWGKVITYKG